MREICSKLIIKTSKRLQGRRSCVFEQTSDIVLVFPLLTLNKNTSDGKLGALEKWWNNITFSFIKHFFQQETIAFTDIQKKPFGNFLQNRFSLKS